MFEQYNLFQKLFRIVIFVALVYLSLTYLSTQELTAENKLKLLAVIMIVFLIYELYYPSVRIEPEQYNKNNESVV
jgi:hypothetical protein